MRRKGVTSPVSSESNKTGKCIKCCTIGKAPLGFSQAQNPPWLGNPSALLDQCWPLRSREKSNEDASIDQVKGIVGKVQSLRGIHHAKLYIRQPLRRG